MFGELFEKAGKFAKLFWKGIDAAGRLVARMVLVPLYKESFIEVVAILKKIFAAGARWWISNGASARLLRNLARFGYVRGLFPVLI